VSEAKKASNLMMLMGAKKIFKKSLTKQSKMTTNNKNFFRPLQRQQLPQRMMTNLHMRARLTAPQLDMADAAAAEDAVDTQKT
jgi:hypothetical protein